jgi:hypothetical protein
MSETNPTQIHATGNATVFMPGPRDKGKPFAVTEMDSIKVAWRKSGYTP